VYLHTRTAGHEQPQTTDYRSLTYLTVERISPHNNGDVFRCAVNFRYDDRTDLNNPSDHVPPTFNFAWRSSPPLNVQCMYGLPSFDTVMHHSTCLFARSWQNCTSSL